MRQIGTIQIGYRQFAEDIIKDRRRLFDAVVALNHARGLELRECECIDEFFQRHTVLQTHRDSDGKVVHHRAETRTFFVHVDENLAQLAVFIFASAQVNLVPADVGLLGIALAALRHLFAVGAHDFLDDYLFDDLFSQNQGLFVHGAAFHDFGSFIIVFDQCCGQRL